MLLTQRIQYLSGTLSCISPSQLQHFDSDIIHALRKQMILQAVAMIDQGLLQDAIKGEA
jgi:hypothetical protein